MIRLIISEFKQWIGFFIIYFPETKLGAYIRKKFWGYVLGERLGPDCIIERGAVIGEPDKVYIGAHFLLGDSAVIAAGDSHPVWIGNHVAIARHSYVRTANHCFSNLNVPILNQGHNCKTILFQGAPYSIVIEDDVWIGANVMLLSGAHIGKGSVVGAGAVINKSIPPYSIVVGNPCRIIKSRIDLAIN